MGDTKRTESESETTPTQSTYWVLNGTDADGREYPLAALPWKDIAELAFHRGMCEGKFVRLDLIHPDGLIQNWSRSKT